MKIFYLENWKKSKNSWLFCSALLFVVYGIFIAVSLIGYEPILTLSAKQAYMTIRSFALTGSSFQAYNTFGGFLEFATTFFSYSPFSIFFLLSPSINPGYHFVFFALESYLANLILLAAIALNGLNRKGLFSSLLSFSLVLFITSAVNGFLGSGALLLLTILVFLDGIKKCAWAKLSKVFFVLVLSFLFPFFYLGYLSSQFFKKLNKWECLALLIPSPAIVFFLLPLTLYGRVSLAPSDVTYVISLFIIGSLFVANDSFKNAKGGICVTAVSLLIGFIFSILFKDCLSFIGLSCGFIVSGVHSTRSQTKTKNTVLLLFIPFSIALIGLSVVYRIWWPCLVSFALLFSEMESFDLRLPKNTPPVTKAVSLLLICSSVALSFNGLTFKNRINNGDLSGDFYYALDCREDPRSDSLNFSSLNGSLNCVPGDTSKILSSFGFSFSEKCFSTCAAQSLLGIKNITVDSDARLSANFSTVFDEGEWKTVENHCAFPLVFCAAGSFSELPDFDAITENPIEVQNVVFKSVFNLSEPVFTESGDGSGWYQCPTSEWKNIYTYSSLSGEKMRISFADGTDSLDFVIPSTGIIDITPYTRDRGLFELSSGSSTIVYTENMEVVKEAYNSITDIKILSKGRYFQGENAIWSNDKNRLIFVRVSVYSEWAFFRDVTHELNPKGVLGLCALNVEEGRTAFSFERLSSEFQIGFSVFMVSFSSATVFTLFYADRLRGKGDNQ